MKKYIIFDLDGTLLNSQNQINKTIYDYIENNLGKDYIDKARYFIINNQGATLFYLFRYLGLDEENSKKHSESLFKELNKIDTSSFMDGTIEKIKELSKKYKLFLSTGSSTFFAETNLEKGGVKNLFEKIMGSDEIFKSVSHIEIFEQISGDSDFCKYALSVGDGQKEEEIAKEKNIDFIHIGGKYKKISDIKFDSY